MERQMTAKQFIAAKKSLRLSSSQMAEALGMDGSRDSSGPRNIRRWCRDGLPATAAGRALAEKIKALVAKGGK